MPRHDSVSPLWVPVLGPSGWHLTATGVQVSINGTTWVNATIQTATAAVITLANGTPGTRCWVTVPIASLAPAAGSIVQCQVRLTNGADSPVMTAAGKTYFE